MTDSDASNHFYSALDTVSSSTVAGAASDVDRGKFQAPPYADDSILICTLPETPCSSASSLSQPTQTLIPPSCNVSRSLPARSKRSFVQRSRRRLRGAKIRSPDSDEEKRDHSLGKERDLEGESVSRSSAPGAHGGVGDRKDGDGSNEGVVPSKQLRFALLDVVKMMCTEPNGSFEDMDILEIAAMKGIYFPPPRWWKPGGYGAEKP